MYFLEFFKIDQYWVKKLEKIIDFRKRTQISICMIKNHSKDSKLMEKSKIS